ncbi:hypothetical protein GCM10010121_088400 [Streptomyces brasiliensis]|uniref:Uncharacterized protein n=1 Tax=Streptomyces brasiliensis TaxID=1954 RepID=A0A917P6I3_9ACTN|nr:hypothetical protein GCM10010121_088400 [Streptomyces brasiliensis]
MTEREHDVLDEDVARMSPLKHATSTAWGATASPPSPREGLPALRDPDTVHLDEDDAGVQEWAVVSQARRAATHPVRRPWSR